MLIHNFQFKITLPLNFNLERDILNLPKCNDNELEQNSSLSQFFSCLNYRLISTRCWQPRSQSSSAISDVTSPVKLVGKIRQPRSQSSSAISDVTSPVKLVGKIRLGRLALSRSVPSLLWSLG